MAKKKRGPTPEQLAEWAEARRGLELYHERLKARIAERREREARRRERLRRLTFGLLGR